MNYPEQYRTELLSTIQGINLDNVRSAIEVFREARAQNRRIFVCGSGRAAFASRDLCDMVRGSTLTRPSRFRIVAVSGELPGAHATNDLEHDRAFVEQLKNIAEPGDVVAGISVSGNSPDILRAFEYASRIGCRIISITGWDGGRLAIMSDVAIVVPATHQGSVEDSLIIVCHMIGYYFVNFDKS
jgi:D-sedoheptulose 7-phosphate isomerase